MATNTSAVSIASNALILLGHTPISSFDESGAGSQVSSSLYETTLLALISSHRWSFTKKTLLLNRLTTSPKNTNWNYQYQLPTDYLEMLGTIDSSDYNIYEDKLVANQNTVTIDYIYRPPESRFPAMFRETFEYLLASKFAIPVTDSTTKAELYFQMYITNLKKAKAVDAQSVPTSALDDYSYLAIRS